MDAAGRGGALLRPMGSRKSVWCPVGADAYIGPAECTDFTVVCGKFVTSKRADVGIGPYNHTSKCLRIRRRFSIIRCVPQGGAEPRPYQPCSRFRRVCVTGHSIKWYDIAFSINYGYSTAFCPVCRHQKNVRSRSSAFFSMRLTCTCDTPMRPATRCWVRLW